MNIVLSDTRIHIRIINNVHHSRSIRVTDQIRRRSVLRGFERSKRSDLHASEPYVSSCSRRTEQVSCNITLLNKTWLSCDRRKILADDCHPLCLLVASEQNDDWLVRPVNGSQGQ